jgi:hypothetical protein
MVILILHLTCRPIRAHEIQQDPAVVDDHGGLEMFEQGAQQLALRGRRTNQAGGLQGERNGVSQLEVLVRRTGHTGRHGCGHPPATHDGHRRRQIRRPSVGPEAQRTQIIGLGPEAGTGEQYGETTSLGRPQGLGRLGQRPRQGAHDDNGHRGAVPQEADQVTFPGHAAEQVNCPTVTPQRASDSFGVELMRTAYGSRHHHPTAHDPTVSCLFALRPGLGDALVSGQFAQQAATQRGGGSHRARTHRALSFLELQPMVSRQHIVSL